MRFYESYILRHFNFAVFWIRLQNREILMQCDNKVDRAFPYPISEFFKPINATLLRPNTLPGMVYNCFLETGCFVCTKNKKHKTLQETKSRTLCIYHTVEGGYFPLLQPRIFIPFGKDSPSTHKSRDNFSRLSYLFGTQRISIDFSAEASVHPP